AFGGSPTRRSPFVFVLFCPCGQPTRTKRWCQYIMRKICHYIMRNSVGTTNSSIAVLTGIVPEVIPNKDGAIATPSAIWFDKRGNQSVGKRAKDQYFDDEENGAVEFKLQMGHKDWRRTFQRTGKQMLPEEMSAEVLKSLKEDVCTAKREDLQAAVITVPAAFELAQCDATRRAAQLAGLTVSPLLLEPVAAALAYGFQSASNKVFWLVYDFGGGTFDAAIIQVRDGLIQVVNHAGDNFLGGKNIDWDIVERLLVPQLAREHPLSEFSRQNPKWRSAFAKLKYAAEEAKIQVSRTGSPSETWTEDLCADDRGSNIDFTFVLTPAALEEITAPWIERSIRLCRKALDEKGLGGQDIEKIILSGGSSLFPWLHDRLSEELGIPLEFSIDPMTVVARGAAVFAGSQRLEAPAPPPGTGTYTIQLEYDPVGNDAEPLVGGKVTPPAGASLDGLRVEIIELRSQWRSGSITLAAGGTFMTEVHAEKERRCEYELVLSDSTGSRLPCAPDRFAYTIGQPSEASSLLNDLGVAQDGNRNARLLKKGAPLPAACVPTRFYTTVALRKNEPYHASENVIRIPFIEGGNMRADCNRWVAVLEIRPDDPRVKRDVPLHSDVEVKIHLDVSRVSNVEVFIPILDEVFTMGLGVYTETRSPGELKRELPVEINRFTELKDRARRTGDARANAILEQMEREQIVETVQRQVAAAQGDPDAQNEADKKLLYLRNINYSVEDTLRWPDLVQEARARLEETRQIVESHGHPGEKQKLKELEPKIEPAIKAGHLELLQEQLEDLRELAIGILVRQPDFWVGWLQYLKEQREQITDQAAADRLFAQGDRAIQAVPYDLEALEAAVRQLIRLLPAVPTVAIDARGRPGGTIILA
ncbi:MAG: Hsp70 family protein, partial [Phycisphaerae bacterium]|nr:Hsp70 family protein [Phycisphaerae bacterium]